MSFRNTLIAIFLIVLLTLGAFTFLIIRNGYINRKRRETAEKKCHEYTEWACNNPSKKNNSHSGRRIIGGSYSMAEQFPHMASLLIDNKFACGGSLISEYFVLTAAHCICIDHKRTKNIEILLGSTFSMLARKMHKSDDGEVFTAEETYVHPDYSERYAIYDIALIKLDRKVNFTSDIRPICLNTELSNNFSNITATGWGYEFSKSGNYSRPDQLKFIDLYIADEDVKSACIQQFGIERLEYVICAGHPIELKSAAKGDSGGPLQILKNKECPYIYEQIGITSAGRDNRENLTFKIWPITYTRVADFVPWIVSNVWPDE